MHMPRGEVMRKKAKGAMAEKVLQASPRSQRASEGSNEL